MQEVFILITQTLMSSIFTALFTSQDQSILEIIRIATNMFVKQDCESFIYWQVWNDRRVGYRFSFIPSYVSL